MMKEDLPSRLADCRLLEVKAAFELLRSYPMIGDFLAYQYVTDLNYSNLLDFSPWTTWSRGPAQWAFKNALPTAVLLRS